MLTAVLLTLILLWVLAYTPYFPNLSVPILHFNAVTITLWDVMLVLVVSWLIGILPSPLRQIASLVFLLWILSVLGIFAMFPALSSILVVVLIVTALFELLGGSSFL